LSLRDRMTTVGSGGVLGWKMCKVGEHHHISADNDSASKNRLKGLGYRVPAILTRFEGGGSTLQEQSRTSPIGSVAIM